MGDNKVQYNVLFTKKVQKAVKKLPTDVTGRFYMLVEQLSEKGPLAPNWQNFSKLGKD